MSVLLKPGIVFDGGNHTGDRGVDLTFQSFEFDEKIGCITRIRQRGEARLDGGRVE